MQWRIKALRPYRAAVHLHVYHIYFKVKNESRALNANVHFLQSLSYLLLT